MATTLKRTGKEREIRKEGRRKRKKIRDDYRNRIKRSEGEGSTMAVFDDEGRISEKEKTKRKKETWKKKKRKKEMRKKKSWLVIRRRADSEEEQPLAIC